jgi:Notch-like protein
MAPRLTVVALLAAAVPLCDGEEGSGCELNGTAPVCPVFDRSHTDESRFLCGTCSNGTCEMQATGAHHQLTQESKCCGTQPESDNRRQFCTNSSRTSTDLCEDFNNIRGTFFRCNCGTGYTGLVCENDVDECASTPCINGACFDSSSVSPPQAVPGDAFFCTCKAGYVGDRCEIDINECAELRCVNGVCHDSNTRGSIAAGAYLCECHAGWAGQHCKLDIDECLESPCKNGSPCTDSNSTNSAVAVGEYSCDCSAAAQLGWGGADCSVDIDDCEQFEGQYSPCGDQATCGNLLNGFNCTCGFGYASDMLVFEVDGVSASVPLYTAAMTTAARTVAAFNAVLGASAIASVSNDGSIVVESSKAGAGSSIVVGSNSSVAGLELLGSLTCSYTGQFTAFDFHPPKNQTLVVVIDGSSLPIMLTTNLSTADKLVTVLNGGMNGLAIANVSNANVVIASTSITAGSSVTVDVASGPSAAGLLANGKGRCQAPFVENTHSGVMVCPNDINECDSAPCRNGGNCVDSKTAGSNIAVGRYSCTCDLGWDGENCNSDVQECLVDPCNGRGTCVDNNSLVPAGTFRCTCNLGWRGASCNIDINECDSCESVALPTKNQTANQAICLAAGCTYTENRDACTGPRYPCNHGASCAESTTDATQKVGTYSCDCSNTGGYSGQNCEADFDECEALPCGMYSTCFESRTNNEGKSFALFGA